jgi:hypothetical protein
MLSALFSSKIATPGELTQYSIGTLAWEPLGFRSKDLQNTGKLRTGQRLVGTYNDLLRDAGIVKCISSRAADWLYLNRNFIRFFQFRPLLL